MTRQRRKKRIKRISFDKKILARNFIILFLLVAVVCSSVAGIKFYNNIKANKRFINVNIENKTTTALSSAQKQIIIDYFTVYAQSLAKLEMNELKPLFDTNTLSCYENAIINELALQTLINIRLAAAEDLMFKNMDIYLRINDIKTEDGKVILSFTEAHAVIFNCMAPETSYTCGVEHTMCLSGIDTNVKIISHTDDSAYLSAEQAYIKEKQNAGVNNTTQADIIAATVSALVDKDIAAFSGVFNTKRLNLIANPEKFVYSMTVSIPYDRTAAVEYANTWCGEIEIKRNSDYSVYDNIGGNCNNFISQCIFAGGIPFDNTGYAQWKHYSDALNEEGGNWGRTTSWTGVTDFYKYCINNTSGGIAAMTDCNFFSGEPGDIIQIGSRGEWNHSVIITGIITDELGNVLDFSINSNTTDRKNYPLSAYGVMYSMRLIKIFGSY